MLKMLYVLFTKCFMSPFLLPLKYFPPPTLPLFTKRPLPGKLESCRLFYCFKLNHFILFIHTYTQRDI